jgi:hypothetical protein
VSGGEIGGERLQGFSIARDQDQIESFACEDPCELETDAA